VGTNSSGGIAFGYLAAVAATAVSGMALGPGADVLTGHNGSVALGPSAQTTAASQIMLGTSSYTVVSPGTFAHTGTSLGLYGKAAVVQASKISDPSGQANDLDSEARTAINAIIDALEGVGITALV
jgi:hypothetical protein